MLFNSIKGHTIIAPRLLRWFGMETKIRSRKEDISISIRNHQTPEWGPAKNVKCGRVSYFSKILIIISLNISQ